jgi:hypothetical protein
MSLVIGLFGEYVSLSESFVQSIVSEIRSMLNEVLVSEGLLGGSIHGKRGFDNRRFVEGVDEGG